MWSLEVTYMFHIFDLFISSDPHILISLGSCALAYILASSYPYVLVYFLVSSHPYILISSGSYALADIPVSSYPQVRVCLLVSLHLHILISSGWYVLAGILASLHPHILRFMCTWLYPFILTFHILSNVCLLVYLRPHILIPSGSYALVGIIASSHPRIIRFMCAC